MTYGLAERSRQHAMGTSDAVYVPRWRVTAPLIVAKGLDGRLQYAYRGDTLAYLSDEQAKHFLRLAMVAQVNAE